MSKRIAPGKWKPIKRQIAKTSSFVVGVAMIVFGLMMGKTLVEGAVASGTQPTMWGVILVLVPLGIGAAAVFPSFIVPVAYRLIDKFMKDAPEDD